MGQFLFMINSTAEIISYYNKNNNVSTQSAIGKLCKTHQAKRREKERNRERELLKNRIINRMENNERATAS